MVTPEFVNVFLCNYVICAHCCLLKNLGTSNTSLPRLGNQGTISFDVSLSKRWFPTP